MKKIFSFLIALVLVLSPFMAAAQFTVPQGGTGTTTFPANWVVMGNNATRLKAMATSTLGLPLFSDLDDYLSLFSWYATTTDALDEGLANLYFTNERAQDGVGSVVGNGLDYDDPSGAIAVDETELAHNSLGGKQGGTTNEYYHLTSAQNTVVGNTSGTNTGDQTSIVGITGTKAQFDTAVTDGNFLYVGDITQYTDELAQDAIGAMIDATLNYVDATPLFQRAALSGDVVAALGSNSTVIQDNSVDGTDIALGSDAGGDLMQYDGSNWVRVPIGGAGQVLEVNAGGTAVEWDTDDSGAGGSPGGADTQVQFNDGGSFGGDSAFTWNKTNDALSAGDNSLTNFSLAKGLWGFASSTPSPVTGFERVIFEDSDGGKSDWSFRVAGGAYGVTNFAGSNGSLSTPATSTSGDTIGAVEFLGYDGTDYEQAAAIRGIVDTPAPGSNDMPGSLHFMTTADGAGAPVDRVVIDNIGALKPATNDGSALGNGTLKWSDLFLASGSVINWNNGDVTLTHSADTLTMAGGALTLGTPLAAGSGGTGLSALGAGVATWLGTPSSANLASAVTGETGSGALVFGTTPTFTTSALSPIWASTAADVADAGVLRLGNAEAIGWEASPAGTDVSLTVDSSEVLTLAGGGFTATAGTATFGTLAGTLDAGGATSFEIPNGTGPTVDTLGEIGFDSTDNQFLVAPGATPLVLPTTQRLWSATIASTSVDFVSGGRVPMPPLRDGATISEIHCFVDGGTSVVINVDVLANGSPTDTLTCDADGAADTAQSANTAYTALGLPVLEVGTITGAVDYVTFSVWGTWTRE